MHEVRYEISYIIYMKYMFHSVNILLSMFSAILTSIPQDWVIEFPCTWKVIKESVTFQGQSASRFQSFLGQFYHLCVLSQFLTHYYCVTGSVLVSEFLLFCWLLYVDHSCLAGIS